MRLVAHLELELHIDQVSEWNRISAVDIAELGVQNAVNKLGGLHRVLELVYPSHDWSASTYLSSVKRAGPISLEHLLMLLNIIGQRSLVSLMKELFPEEQLIENYKHPELRFASGRPMELDLYLPRKALAFEYQGRQHFQSNTFFGSVDERRVNDDEKAEACRIAGITLIAIPQTSLSRNALTATIKQHRSDIL